MRREDGREVLGCTSCCCCSSLLSPEPCAPTGRHSNLLTSSALCYFRTLCRIKDNHHLVTGTKSSHGRVRKRDKRAKQMAGGLFTPVSGAVYILK